MTPRTSHTHPLRVDRLRLKRGTIGMTICPGKKGPSVRGAPWLRDMREDMQHLVNEGVTTIVTLMEWEELKAYRAQHIKIEAEQAGLKWIFFPFQDRSIPNSEQSEEWKAVSCHIHAALNTFETVLIHCLGGLGRTGTVASMLLQDLGQSPDESIKNLRAVRAGTVETASQEVFLSQYKGWKS